MKQHLLTFIVLSLLTWYTPTEQSPVKDWQYQIDYDYENANDSIQPIGKVVFQSTKPIPDQKRESIYGRKWFPSITFEIHPLSNKAYCEKSSFQVQLHSSCLPPNMGGDVIVVQDYIFHNRNVCVDCVLTEGQIDYCRPVVQEVLSNLNLTGVKSLAEIDQKIGLLIKRAE